MTRGQLHALIKEAWNLGVASSGDLAQAHLCDWLVKHRFLAANDPKVYAAMELASLPVGTKICHSLLGEGEICTRQGVRAFVRFANGQAHLFNSNEYPWNMPLVLLDPSLEGVKS